MSKRNADWDELHKLFVEYGGGETASVHRLFTEFQRVLTAFFKMRLNVVQDAEDLTQATLLKIHFARHKYDPIKSLQTWIFTIASRTLIDHWRGFEPETDDLVSVGEIIAAPELTPDIQIELQRDLSRALDGLKPLDRQIIYLYAVEGLTMSEISDVVGLTETAVKLRAHRSYSKLRGELASWLLALLGLGVVGGA